MRSVQQGNDIEAIGKASQELSEAMQKVGEAVYSQQQPPDEAGEAPPEEGGDDEDTVEGEFKEV